MAAKTDFRLFAEMRKNGITVPKDSARWDDRIAHITAEDRARDAWADTDMVMWDDGKAAAQSSDEDVRDERAAPNQKLYNNWWVILFDSGLS